MRYVAFLRGVNVGGRILRMADVRAAMVAAGFADASTYLQTGNILFDGSNQSPFELQTQVTEVITSLDPTVRLTMRSAEDCRRRSIRPHRRHDGFPPLRDFPRD